VRILIVDDDEAIRDGLRHIVENLGAEVVAEADDGRSGIESARANGPELILLDVSMPGMNGFTAARQLHDIMPHVPIVLVSQHNNRVYAEEAMQIGVRGFVLKASAVTELAQAIPAVMAGGTFVSPAISARLEHRPT
jgi:DNA-binding NarL/FixJ family response regulator